jgi:DNA-binding transcriptional LysR family regulator
MDWDNLRFFLELARAGTLVGAARRLGVDHTTVARRIQGWKSRWTPHSLPAKPAATA